MKKILVRAHGLTSYHIEGQLTLRRRYEIADAIHAAAADPYEDSDVLVGGNGVAPCWTDNPKGELQPFS